MFTISGDSRIMGFTLDHLKEAQDALLQGDQLVAMKNLNILIDHWERLHHEQKIFTKQFKFEKQEIKQNGKQRISITESQ
jgi:hypothetical protein